MFDLTEEYTFMELWTQGDSWATNVSGVEAATGFEPVDNGFANRRLSPLGYAASFE